MAVAFAVCLITAWNKLNATEVPLECGAIFSQNLLLPVASSCTEIRKH